MDLASAEFLIEEAEWLLRAQNRRPHQVRELRGRLRFEARRLDRFLESVLPPPPSASDETQSNF